MCLIALIIQARHWCHCGFLLAFELWEPKNQTGWIFVKTESFVRFKLSHAKGYADDGFSEKKKSCEIWEQRIQHASHISLASNQKLPLKGEAEKP